MQPTNKAESADTLGSPAATANTGSAGAAAPISDGRAGRMVPKYIHRSAPPPPPTRPAAPASLDVGERPAERPKRVDTGQLSRAPTPPTIIDDTGLSTSQAPVPGPHDWVGSGRTSADKCSARCRQRAPDASLGCRDRSHCSATTDFAIGLPSDSRLSGGDAASNSVPARGGPAVMSGRSLAGAARRLPGSR